MSVNDAFRPLSRFFDRVWRPEQLPAALLGAMRVLTDPAETGAVTIALPQDVQAEAHDWPDELFAQAGLARPPAGARARRAGPRGSGDPRGEGAADRRRRRGASTPRRPTRCAAFAEATGIPVADTQAGKGALLWDHPLAVGGVGSTGTPVANALARDADVVIGVGTRYSDFTTASRTAFQHPRRAVRQPQRRVVRRGQARRRDARRRRPRGPRRADRGAGRATTWRTPGREHAAGWNRVVDDAFHLGHQPLPAQTEVLGALNEELAARDVVVQAAGSMPGDLQMLWRARDPKQYHVEYGYSCMGYEIAGALGIKMAAPDREVFALVGDGSYLMMARRSSPPCRRASS